MDGQTSSVTHIKVNHTSIPDHESEKLTDDLLSSISSTQLPTPAAVDIGLTIDEVYHTLDNGLINDEVNHTLDNGVTKDEDNHTFDNVLITDGVNQGNNTTNGIKHSINAGQTTDDHSSQTKCMNILLFTS